MQLALVGSMATDDPEGWEFFNSTMAYADGDPDIHILNNLNSVGAIEVNAFQSQADVVIQKSTREGFGLTVSEALWKGRPFIGGDVGGIPLQVQDGETGFLVSSPDECAERSLRVLREPDLGKRLGRAGKEHVRKHFLTPAPAARLAEDLPGTAMTKEAALVLVSNRGPATFEDGEPRRGGGGLVTALTGPGPPPRRGLGRLDDDRGRRGGRAASTAAASFELELDGADVPDPAGRVRPGGLRRASTTWSRTRCCGSSSTTSGTSRTRPTSAATRSRPTSTATAWSTTTWRARCSRRSRASRTRS